MTQGRPGKGRLDPAIARENHDDREVACQRESFYAKRTTAGGKSSPVKTR